MSRKIMERPLPTRKKEVLPSDPMTAKIPFKKSGDNQLQLNSTKTL
jgi:hypothetical protein